MGEIQELRKQQNLLTKEAEKYFIDYLKYVDRIENLEIVNFDNIYIN